MQSKGEIFSIAEELITCDLCGSNSIRWKGLEHVLQMEKITWNSHMVLPVTLSRRLVMKAKISNMIQKNTLNKLSLKLHKHLKARSKQYWDHILSKLLVEGKY